MTKEANLPTFSDAERIDHGTRSVCYKNGTEVFKIMSGFNDLEAAQSAQNELIKEHEIVAKYLSGYVVDSEFEVYANSGNFFIVIRQSYIKGVSLKEAVVAKSGSIQKHKILDFLQKSLLLYEDTGDIPDLFGRPHIFGWYDMVKTPNVIVETENNLYIPRLVDTGFTRLSKNKITGSTHNMLLAKNIERVIKEIET